MSVAWIRPAHTAEAETLHAVHLACWQEAYAEHLPAWMFEKARAEGLARWEAILDDPRGVWVAQRDGEAVGFAVAVAAGAGQVRPLELTKLYVRASEYGTGTSMNLLYMAVGDAPCLTWVAGYNTRAQRFYVKSGFTLDEGPGSERVEAQWGDLPMLRMVR